MSSKAKNSEAITGYLAMELVKMGYHIEINRSNKSKDSWYIKICTGIGNNHSAIRVRISDHNTLPKYRMTSRYDFDISVFRYRKNAITFIEFFTLFASRQKKPVPQEIANIMSATMRGPTHLQAA
jgi:hypothetical protein